MYFIIGRRA
jgi:hypothetical protein